MSPDQYASVRYLVDDVPAAVDFYTTHLGFAVHTNAPAFADVTRGALRLLLSGPTSSGARATPDDADSPGHNRIHLVVDDLDAEIDRLRRAGLSFRSEPVSGPGGRQILLADPSDNLIELFHPAHPVPEGSGPWTARVERLIPATPERVWRAFTTEEVAAWYWPQAWQLQVAVDVRVGGRFRLSSEVAGTAVEGEYAVVEPPRRLVHTWRWDGEDGETLVTITLQPDPAGTLLLVVHERFATQDERDQHVQGWSDCLGRLPGQVAASDTGATVQR